MAWSHLLSELAITASDPQVWLAIALALLLGGGCLVFGTWIARTVGLLPSDAPAGETLGVGLASGLIVLAAWWAAIWSGGRSSFTPVAVGFAIALALAQVRRVRRPTVPDLPAHDEPGVADEPTEAGRTNRSTLLLASLAGGAFVVAVALLYGATMAPSPRDGVQPVEFRDVAFYAVLGRDLAASGTETNLSPSGFSDLPGQPSQTWYHWGELWLAAAVITVFGTAPLAARYFVVLPLLLLAAAALTGTVVRRVTGTGSRGAYLFGFLACLLLTPVPFVTGSLYDEWLPWGAVYPLAYGITTYGLAAVAVLLALYGLAVFGLRPASRALSIFGGSAVAFILPAHIVIAMLGLVGVASAWAVRIGSSIVKRRLPSVTPAGRGAFIATATVLLATVAWGLVTGHSLGAGAVSPSVSPFDGTWRDSVLVAIFGAGAFLAIPVAWLVDRTQSGLRADLYLGTMVLLVAGAMVWGARLGDFNMFYFFYGGIAVFATPVAAVAAWSIWTQLRATGHARLAAVALVLCAVQLEAGVAIGTFRMFDHGPGPYAPVNVELLTAIKELPADAKLAYACRPSEEVFAGTPALLALSAHTGRGVVPMCFEADVFGTLLGGKPSTQTPGADFATAPQRALYPDAAANPSSAAVAAFLRDHGIDYIYADAKHPNSLVAGAITIARSADAEILEAPMK